MLNVNGILALLDTVIRDLEHPTTMRAPDGVFLDLKRRVIEARAAVDALETSKSIPQEPVKKGK